MVFFRHPEAIAKESRFVILFKGLLRRFTPRNDDVFTPLFLHPWGVKMVYYSRDSRPRGNDSGDPTSEIL